MQQNGCQPCESQMAARANKLCWRRHSKDSMQCYRCKDHPAQHVCRRPSAASQALLTQVPETQCPSNWPPQCVWQALASSACNTRHHSRTPAQHQAACVLQCSAAAASDPTQHTSWHSRTPDSSTSFSSCSMTTSRAEDSFCHTIIVICMQHTPHFNQHCTYC